MKIHIRRKDFNGETWFELLGLNLGVEVLIDIDALIIYQKSGHEIIDIDAIRADMARNN